VWDNLRRDARRLAGAYGKKYPWYLPEALLFDNGFQAVVFYRMASWCKHRRIPVLGPLLSRLGLLVTGADLSPRARIGPGLRISHGTGLVVGGWATIGSGALLLHGVTVGSPSEGRIDQMPTVGDNVFLGAGATLIGAITVGDDVVVGPHAVVLRDLPDGARVRAPEPVIAAPDGG
jgi:serine O-acetyltransferase